MFVETHPFPYLKSGEYINIGRDEIVIMDQTLSEEKVKWLKEEYKKWYKEREKIMIENDEC